MAPVHRSPRHAALLVAAAVALAAAPQPADSTPLEIELPAGVDRDQFVTAWNHVAAAPGSGCPACVAEAAGGRAVRIARTDPIADLLAETTVALLRPGRVPDGLAMVCEADPSAGAHPRVPAELAALPVDAAAEADPAELLAVASGLAVNLGPDLPPLRETLATRVDELVAELSHQGVQASLQNDAWSLLTTRAWLELYEPSLPLPGATRFVRYVASDQPVRDAWRYCDELAALGDRAAVVGAGFLVSVGVPEPTAELLETQDWRARVAETWDRPLGIRLARTRPGPSMPWLAVPYPDPSPPRHLKRRWSSQLSHTVVDLHVDGAPVGEVVAALARAAGVPARAGEGRGQRAPVYWRADDVRTAELFTLAQAYELTVSYDEAGLAVWGGDTAESWHGPPLVLATGQWAPPAQLAAAWNHAVAHPPSLYEGCRADTTSDGLLRMHRCERLTIEALVALLHQLSPPRDQAPELFACTAPAPVAARASLPPGWLADPEIPAGLTLPELLDVLAGRTGSGFRLSAAAARAPDTELQSTTIEAAIDELLERGVALELGQDGIVANTLAEWAWAHPDLAEGYGRTARFRWQPADDAVEAARAACRTVPGVRAAVLGSGVLLGEPG